MAKVTLYLRFETSHVERSFARPVASNSCSEPARKPPLARRSVPFGSYEGWTQ